MHAFLECICAYGASCVLVWNARAEKFEACNRGETARDDEVSLTLENKEVRATDSNRNNRMVVGASALGPHNARCPPGGRRSVFSQVQNSESPDPTALR